jgi:predicted trehalose synthase
LGPADVAVSTSVELQGADQNFRNLLLGLLDAFILDKVLYELLYELDNRPGWLRVPLGGILGLDVE